MRFLVIAVAAMFALGAGSVASGSMDSPKASAAKGKRGPRGRRGPAGPPGVANVTEVESAPIVLPPGGFGAPPNADCPEGMTVIGTGFDGPFGDTGGFVKSYTYFVGGFFANDSSITVDGKVQAICAETTGSVRRRSLIDERARYEADVKEAMAAQKN